MRQLIRIELYKLLHTKRFWICLLIGIAISMLNVLYFWDGWQQKQAYWKELMSYYGAQANPAFPSFTLYNTWIGNEGYTFSVSVLYFVFPLLCCIPFGWTLNEDVKTGYLKNIAVRTDRKKYFFAKYLCTFFSGGFTMATPLIVNFVANAMFIPALRPDTKYPYYTMLQRSFLSDMYCEKPLLFNIIYLLISFGYCGLIAMISCACGYVMNHKVIAVIVPFGGILLMHYLSTMLSGNGYEWSPLYCIHATPIRYPNSGGIILLYSIVMLLITFGIMYRKGKQKYEIY